jgi:hypothetical protein
MLSCLILKMGNFAFYVAWFRTDWSLLDAVCPKLSFIAVVDLLSYRVAEASYPRKVDPGASCYQ